MARRGLLSATGRFAVATALLAFAAAAWWAASAASSATLTLSGTISPKCEFTTATPGLNFDLAPGIIDIGNLGYTCNLPEGSFANFTLTITNGGLKNASSGQVVPYEVQWNVDPNNGTQAWQDAATFLNGVGFQWITSAAGVERTGLFRIRINALPPGLQAGTYTSVVTYTISP